MITDIAAYLRFFDSVRRRTERDVAALPPAAVAWRPPAAAGEAGWGIGQIVAHIGVSRLYFASPIAARAGSGERPRPSPATSGRGCRGSSGRRSGSRLSCARRPRPGSPGAWR